MSKIKKKSVIHTCKDYIDLDLIHKNKDTNQ